MTTDEYLRGEETNRRRELIYGVVRDAPSPFLYHQDAVVQLASSLHAHVTREGLGHVYVSPLDVILDTERALILQPDILFVSAANRGILRDWVRGAPDLVIEVLSKGAEDRDRVDKRRWYGEYGVKEYWIVDSWARSIDVVDYETGSTTTYGPRDTLQSRLLPGFSIALVNVFGYAYGR